MSPSINNPQNLVVLVKGYPRLSETFIAQEIRSLEKAGFSLRIVSMRQPTDKEIHPVHREIAAPVTYLPEYLHNEPLRVLRGLLKASRLPAFKSCLRSFLIDLRHDISRNRVRRFGQAAVMASEMPENIAQIHAHFIHTPASVARYTSILTGLPWSCSAHAKDIWTTPDQELANKLRDAAFTVTCTEAGLNRLNALAPAENPARLVYHGLDLSRFKPLIVPSTQRTGSDQSRPVRFLTIARAVEKKGLDTLIEALAALPPDLHWTWTHIGGGTLVKKLTAQAQKHGLSQRCKFLGARAQEEVIAAYANHEIFILPCRIARDGDRDGLPNVLMEAGSQGMTLVSTPVSGVTELIEDGVTGCIVQPDQPQILSATLSRLAADPMERYRLGQAVSQKVFTHFDHDKAMQGLVTLFPSRLVTQADKKRGIP
jgi:glycosyltransferase involved in cell wall biosynthesis